METTTPFDLNQAIQRWRENLGQSPAFRAENLYELETHLRDSIETLMRMGLSDQESFLIANKRLGNNSTLEAEFANENATSIWLDRALWILLGIQLWGSASVLSFSLQTFLRAFIPKINEWLAMYGFGRISEAIPGQLFFVVALPLTILAAAKLFSVVRRLSERRGWFSINSILSKPLLLGGVYGALCFLPLVIQYFAGILVRSYSLERYSGMSLPSGYGLYGLIFLQTAIFAAIVMVIGKRRLRLSRN
jgi:hypothetical protein